MFEAAAWTFGPCITAVPYIRPVISIDASFLSGRYKGKLLATCGYDPEQRLLPLAFAIVRTENEESLMTVVTIDVERGEFEVHVPYEKDFLEKMWKYKVLIKHDYQPEDPQLPSRHVTCECKKPQLTGIPCAHVVAVCDRYRWEVDDFVDEQYSMENMLKIWSSSDFHCYGDEENWPRYDGPVVFPDRNIINRGRRKKDRN
ncbi:hypothetical protein LUZ63_007397 [Rhynchospora breviuscula]|uniref:SWIM-type domain-containing protein n=1 Tax=Rhynchospora breviuscula TaxID=2022672 RepID=A0A9Q0CS73_9POAL|nr:hypothetical protein LUZ63_007397 [Rhynchospora breviuscula]